MRLMPMPGVFPPHSDSWLLASYLTREPLRAPTKVLDLCSGSGVLAVQAAARPACEVVAVDVSRRAVLATRINAILNRVRVRAVRGDLFQPVRRDSFDLIVSNPPYLPGPSTELPAHGPARAWEAGRSGRALIDRICTEAAAHLNPGGVLLLVQSSVCGERETRTQLTAQGLHTDVIARSRGPLGPRLRSRARWLREHGLLPADELEEILVIRAQRPSTRRGAPGPPRPRPQ
jgi:release factor glutamine methyltransferase